MKVRNFLFGAMMLLFVPMWSCSSDDTSQEDVPAPKEDPVATTLRMVVDVVLPEDFFVFADVYLGYIDAKGEQVSEKLTSPEIDKEIAAAVDKVNTLGYCVILQSKSLTEHQSDTYEVGTKTNNSTWLLYDQFQQRIPTSPIPKVFGTYHIKNADVERYVSEHTFLLNKAYKLTGKGDDLEPATIDWEFDFISE